jgi:RNA polymerase sigma factor (TIGR02999 family)
MSLVYGELKRLAGYYLRGEKPGHLLQPTALVHEAYLRLTSLSEIDWQNSAQFFAISSQMMRRILVDHARAQMAEKRGGAISNVPLCEVPEVSIPSHSPAMLISLEEALQRLASMNQRHSQVVELRYFGGLTENEVAIVLGVSTRTIKREWRLAKAWLYAELKPE